MKGCAGPWRASRVGERPAAGPGRPAAAPRRAADAGGFVLSIDLELIWGVHDRPYRDEFVPVVRAARRALPGLVELLDRHRVPATWAVVGHLLEGCADTCAAVDRAVAGPAGLPCRAGLDEELWRLPGLVARLGEAEVEHDVAGHGFWHLDLAAAAGPDARALAREEFGASFRAVDAAFRRPTAYVYPRDRVVWPAELARAGFRVARTRPDWWIERLPGPLSRAGRLAAEALRATPPPARLTRPEGEGPARLSASQQLRPERGAWAAVPASTRTARAARGLERAAANGSLHHLWLHPHDLVDAGGSAAAGLARIREILERAAALREAGRLRTITMADAWSESCTSLGEERP